MYLLIIYAGIEINANFNIIYQSRMAEPEPAPNPTNAQIFRPSANSAIAQVRFATVTVINPPDWKVANRTSELGC